MVASKQGASWAVFPLQGKSGPRPRHVSSLRPQESTSSPLRTGTARHATSHVPLPSTSTASYQPNSREIPSHNTPHSLPQSPGTPHRRSQTSPLLQNPFPSDPPTLLILQPLTYVHLRRSGRLLVACSSGHVVIGLPPRRPRLEPPQGPSSPPALRACLLHHRPNDRYQHLPHGPVRAAACRSCSQTPGPVVGWALGRGRAGGRVLHACTAKVQAGSAAQRAGQRSGWVIPPAPYSPTVRADRKDYFLSFLDRWVGRMSRNVIWDGEGKGAGGPYSICVSGFPQAHSTAVKAVAASVLAFARLLMAVKCLCTDILFRMAIVRTIAAFSRGHLSSLFPPHRSPSPAPAADVRRPPPTHPAHRMAARPADPTAAPRPMGSCGIQRGWGWTVLEQCMKNQQRAKAGGGPGSPPAVTHSPTFAPHTSTRHMPRARLSSISSRLGVGSAAGHRLQPVRGRACVQGVHSRPRHGSAESTQARSRPHAPVPACLATRPGPAV